MDTETQTSVLPKVNLDASLAAIGKKRNAKAETVVKPEETKEQVKETAVVEDKKTETEKTDTDTSKELVLNMPKTEVKKEEKKNDTKAESKAEPVAAAEEKPKAKSKTKFWEPAEQASAIEQVATHVAVELPQDVKDEIAYLRSVIDKPSVKSVLAAEESGEPFIEYIDKIRGNNPEKLSSLDLYKLKLQESGKPAEVVERMAELFDMKDEIDQDMLVEDFKAKKIREYKESLEKATPNVMTKAKEEAEKRAKTHNEFLGLAKSLEGKVYDKLGIQITPERSKELQNYFTNNSLLAVREDGSIDPEDLLELATFKLFKKAIFNSIHENAYKEGFEALEAKINQPLGAMETTSVSTPTPVRSGAKTDLDKQKEGLLGSLPGIRK